MEETLLIVKPDAMAAKALGPIITRLEAEGFALGAMRLLRLESAQAEEFYSVHRERPFFADLVTFMTSGPVVPMVLARADAVAHLRRFIGPTNSTTAPAGTIRGDFGTDVQRNAVHASDSLANAAREIDFFFANEK
jgi:nucleoside-diphosphate kinase